MPHNAASSMMDQLGVQFGAMDFGADTGGLSFDTGSSITSGYSSTNAVSASLQVDIASVCLCIQNLHHQYGNCLKSMCKLPVQMTMILGHHFVCDPT